MVTIVTMTTPAAPIDAACTPSQGLAPLAGMIALAAGGFAQASVAGRAKRSSAAAPMAERGFYAKAARLAEASSFGLRPAARHASRLLTASRFSPPRLLQV